MTKRDSKKPTRGQLERSLSQKVQKFYREQLGHSTGQVTCQLNDDKLTIIVESSLTQPEQLLLKECDIQKVEQIRSDLDGAVRPKLIQLVEEVLERQVIDLMSDTTLETGRTGFVIILSDEPQMRETAETSLKVAKAS
ncbi:MAG TPA: DUF2294 domain-containing protein [Candidatus Obscuribacterales bacterium]